MFPRVLPGVIWIVVGSGLLLPTSKLAAQQRNEKSPEIYQKQHQEYHRELATTLEQIAKNCAASGLNDAAVSIRQLAIPVNPREFSAIALPTKLQGELPLDLPAIERTWRSQVRVAQEAYARDLYLLARRVLNGGFPSYAYQLIQEVAHHDPDQKSARRLLGYIQYQDEWVTPYAARMLSRRYVWHDKYGWILKTWIPRYDKGERNFKGRWMTKEREYELRQDFANAWEIRTDHFLLKTNYSLERGVELANALEDYYRFFFSVFAGFFQSPAQMEKLFEGGLNNQRPPAIPQPYEVHYYRTKDEYVARLKSRIPQIAITNGLYFTGDRISYFFYDPKATDLSTLYHEATHQLMYESQAYDREIATRANFWIIEGIACYMESFEKKGERYTVGNPDYIRFQAARYRVLEDRYYVRMREFAEKGLQAFQQDRNISKNYSQASGLSQFFMHYDGGVYRDALIEHLSQIYRVHPRRPSRVASLPELTGVSYEELDKQYVLFVKQQAQSFNQQRDPAP